MLKGRHRVRIWFRKEGDLRMIGHRDLARTLERLCRRAGLPLRSSEGFHPKARISFPSALALGVRGLNEVCEVELDEPVAADELIARLQPHLPPGLAINAAEVVAAGCRKAQVRRLSYELPVPAGRRAAAQAAIEQLLARSSCPVRRAGRDGPVDVRAGLEALELARGAVRFTLRADRTTTVRPREVLEAIGLSDLEEQGYYLTRTAVEIAPQNQPKRTRTHEKGNAD